MNRKRYLAAVSAAGVAATAGCNAVTENRTLSDPIVNEDSPGRKTIIFTANDGEVGHLGVDGHVESNRIDLSTEIWHQDGTCEVYQVEALDARDSNRVSCGGRCLLSR